jgi:cytochrome c
VWTAKTLDAWLSNPEALIPGQRMNYSVRSAEDRRLIIEYLSSDSVTGGNTAAPAP